MLVEHLLCVSNSNFIFVDLDYILFFFFFKKKTAYEMRISDWSSDVCSSDLVSKYSSSIVGLQLAVSLSRLAVDGRDFRLGKVRVSRHFDSGIGHRALCYFRGVSDCIFESQLIRQVRGDRKSVV